MSLLLDALKQAEQNKKKTTEAGITETGVGCALNATSEPLAVVEYCAENQDKATAVDTQPKSEQEYAAGPAASAAADIATTSFQAPCASSDETAVADRAALPLEQNAAVKSKSRAATLNPALNVFSAGGDKPSKNNKNTRLFALLLMLVLITLGLLSAYFRLSIQPGTPVYADDPSLAEPIPGDEATAAITTEPVTQPRELPPQPQLPMPSRPVEKAASQPSIGAATTAADETRREGGSEQLLITGKHSVEIKKHRLTRHQSEQLNRAYQALLAGNYDKARSNYQQVLAETPKQVDALLGLAKIRSHENQPEEARRLYEKVLSIDESNSVAQLGLLHTYQDQPPFDKINVLEQLADKYPQSPQIAVFLGHELARQSKWRPAQQAYFRAFSLAPGNALYAYNLAVSLDRMEKYGAARQYYQKALALNGDGTGVLNAGAVKQRLLQLGEHDD